MKQILVLILSLIFTFPAHLFAQEITDTQPILIDLKEGHKAPFDGILLNPPAAAKMLATQNFTEEKCILLTEFELEKQKAKLDLMISNLNLRIESAEEKHTSLIQIRDEEIMRLQSISMESPNEYSHWWLAGGVVAGIALTISVFAIAAEFK